MTDLSDGQIVFDDETDDPEWRQQITELAREDAYFREALRRERNYDDGIVEDDDR